MLLLVLCLSTQIALLYTCNCALVTEHSGDGRRAMQGHAWEPSTAAVLHAAQAEHGDEAAAVLQRLVKQAACPKGLALPASLQQAVQALANALLHSALWASRPLLLEPVGPVQPLPSSLLEQAGCTLVQMCPQLQQVCVLCVNIVCVHTEGITDIAAIKRLRWLKDYRNKKFDRFLTHRCTTQQSTPNAWLQQRISKGGSCTRCACCWRQPDAWPTIPSPSSHPRSTRAAICYAWWS